MISAVAISCHGRVVCTFGCDDRRTVSIYELPEQLLRGLGAPPDKTFIIRRPTHTVSIGGEEITFVTSSPNDTASVFRFATIPIPNLK